MTYNELTPEEQRIILYKVCTSADNVMRRCIAPQISLIVAVGGLVLMMKYRMPSSEFLTQTGDVLKLFVPTAMGTWVTFLKESALHPKIRAIV